jgi:hypothetical protein
MAKTTAYRKGTGEKVRVPEHWLGHPTLGADLQRTKPTAAQLEQRASGGDTDNDEPATPAPAAKKGR